MNQQNNDISSITFSQNSVSNRRRYRYYENVTTVGKINYTVLSAFPIPDSDSGYETVSDKMRYLISGKKVNKKFSGL